MGLKAPLPRRSSRPAVSRSLYSQKAALAFSFILIFACHASRATLKKHPVVCSYYTYTPTMPASQYGYFLLTVALSLPLMPQPPLTHILTPSLAFSSSTRLFLVAALDRLSLSPLHIPDPASPSCNTTSPACAR